MSADELSKSTSKILNALKGQQTPKQVQLPFYTKLDVRPEEFERNSGVVCPFWIESSNGCMVKMKTQNERWKKYGIRHRCDFYGELANERLEKCILLKEIVGLFQCNKCIFFYKNEGRMLCLRHGLEPEIPNISFDAGDSDLVRMRTKGQKFSHLAEIDRHVKWEPENIMQGGCPDYVTEQRDIFGLKVDWVTRNPQLRDTLIALFDETGMSIKMFKKLGIRYRDIRSGKLTEQKADEKLEDDLEDEEVEKIAEAQT